MMVIWRRILLVSSPPLALEATIPLHDVHGRIDHMAIDLPRKRLMVAELGNNTVDVIDLDKGTSVHRISGLPPYYYYWDWDNASWDDLGSYVAIYGSVVCSTNDW